MTNEPLTRMGWFARLLVGSALTLGLAFVAFGIALQLPLILGAVGVAVGTMDVLARDA